MCPGPDTSSVKTALLGSALVGTATANVAVNVLAVNDAPELADFDDTTVAVEQTAMRLDPDVTVSDAELDSLDGGAGLYTGATSRSPARRRHCGRRVRLRHHGRAVHRQRQRPQIRRRDLRDDRQCRRHAHHHVHQHRTSATTALVNDVLRHITYTNTATRRPGRSRWSICSPTETPAFKARAELEAYSPRRPSTSLPVDDPTILADDSATTNENSAAFIKVIDNDSDPDAPLVIRAINGTPIAVNGTVLVANGKVSLGGDGTLVYEPGLRLPRQDLVHLSGRNRTALSVLRPGDVRGRLRQRHADPDRGWHRWHRDGLRRRGAGTEPQRQHRQLRHPLHRRDQCRDRRQLHVLHHLG